MAIIGLIIGWFIGSTINAWIVWLVAQLLNFAFGLSIVLTFWQAFWAGVALSILGCFFKSGK